MYDRRMTFLVKVILLLCFTFCVIRIYILLEMTGKVIILLYIVFFIRQKSKEQ